MKHQIAFFLVMVVLATPAFSQDKQDHLNTAQFEILLRNLADGWNAGDSRKAANCFTIDAIYMEPPNKQLYRGRDELFTFFGGNSGRAGAMQMTWHHIAFNEEQQIGSGEFSFTYGSTVHGVAMIKIKAGKIHRWREYWYESPLQWDDFIGESTFQHNTH